LSGERVLRWWGTSKVRVGIGGRSARVRGIRKRGGLVSHKKKRKKRRLLPERKVKVTLPGPSTVPGEKTKPAPMPAWRSRSCPY